MDKYEVRFRKLGYIKIEVEAESEKEAREKAIEKMRDYYTTSYDPALEVIRDNIVSLKKFKSV